MSHWDHVLPGVVLRVYYEEEPVRDTEAAVRTASSEQVRRPIYRAAIEHWHRFEPHLAPLKEALGTALTDYPYR